MPRAVKPRRGAVPLDFAPPPARRRAASRKDGRKDGPKDGTPPFARIYAVVARIPRGKVATYGQVARLAGRVTARLVGFAMAATPDDLDLPWQRVINARGEVSPRRSGDGHVSQRKRLEREGVRFDAAGKVDLARHGWAPEGVSPSAAVRATR